MPTVLLTGGHSGIGLTGAKLLATGYSCNLILAGRSIDRLEQAAQVLRSQSNASINVLKMDLNSLASVTAAAAECKKMLHSLDEDAKLESIVCNAGFQSKGPISYSIDGYEETFASNCLGHFLLVNLLIDCLSSAGRVIWTASGTHDPALMDGRTVGIAAEPDARFLAEQGLHEKPIANGRRYATSKLCTILYSYELHRRFQSSNSLMSSIAYDPGFIPEIGMGTMAPAIFRTAGVKFLLSKLGMTMGQMPLSGEALGILAKDTKYANKSGKYYNSNNGLLREARSSDVSYDQERASKLWKDSQELIDTR